MPNKFARSAGNFNNAAIWSTSPNTMVATTVPDSSDVAYANSFAVTITESLTCLELRSDTTNSANAGGSYTMGVGGTVQANIFHFGGASIAVGGSATLNVTSTDTVTLVGNQDVGVNSGSSSNPRLCVLHSGTGNLIVRGNISSSGSGGFLGCLISNSTGSLTIVGNIIPGGNPGAVVSNSNSAVNFTGTISNTLGPGANAAGLVINSNADVTITGNLNFRSATGNCLALNNCRTCNITGVVDSIGTSTGNAIELGNPPICNIIGSVAGSGTAASHGIRFTTTNNTILNIFGSVIGGGAGNGINNTQTGNTIIRISGNILNAANGTQAIYAPSYRIDPVPTNGYIRYARNGTGVGSDAWLYQFTTDSLSAFSMPPVSAVRFGTTFANGTLTGTCAMPNPASVSFGVPVDNTTGTAILNPSDVFSVSIASLSAEGTLGNRLKNSATLQGVGHLVASFNSN